MIEFSFGFLVPTWWEIQIAVSAAVFLIAVYWFVTIFCDDDGGLGFERAIGEDGINGRELLHPDDKDKVGFVEFCRFFG